MWPLHKILCHRKIVVKRQRVVLSSGRSQALVPCCLSWRLLVLKFNYRTDYHLICYTGQI